MQNASIILEFPKIAQEVSFFAHSERGKESSLNLKRLAKDELIEELSYLKETIDLIARYGYLPIDSSADLRNVMEYASRGGVLSAHELEAVATDAKTLNNLRDYFKKVELSPLLIDYSKTLPILDEVEEKIHHVIGPDLEVLDDASPALRSIRIKRKRLEEKSLSSLSILLNKYRPYLNGSSFALKNGHYCLPVANAYKSKVSGALQDVSSSGETVFVEPAELLMIHNQIAEAEAEEKDEIARILRALSQDVASHKGEILEANEKIAKLDFLQAKAKYAEKYKANTANVSERKEIVIYGARHPLLDQSKVVANDFALYENERIVIISGPNAGGKTVALKTLGLMVMMHEAGLAIPASVGAEISYVDNVYCDIGDGQSIEENLSEGGLMFQSMGGVVPNPLVSTARKMAKAAIEFMNSADFYDRLSDGSERDRLFMELIVGTNSVLLTDANDIRSKLRAKLLQESPYYWFGSSEVQKYLKSMVDKEYKLRGSEMASQIIDRMDTAQLREYLKRRIDEDAEPIYAIHN